MWKLVGLAARVEIVPNAPIFKSYTVPPRELHYSPDNTVVLVALKVDTARAVGGLVQSGHRVDVWRIAKAPPDRALEPDTLLALHGAGVELLATDLRVVSVRAGQASQVAAPPGLGLGIGGVQEAAAET
jgi:Flp pilus assembly protein CpaB